MIHEKSCGAIIYTKDSGSIQYVIIRSKNGIYGFPKGHVEGSEREKETALREILEETGLTINLIPGFKAVDTYSFTHNGEKRVKRVVYFLGSFANQTPKIQEAELLDIRLMEYDQAIEVLEFPNLKKLLTQAHNFLIKA